MTGKTRKTVVWAGALLTTALVVGAVAAAPFSIADTATDTSGIDNAAAIIEAADIKSSAD